MARFDRTIAPGEAGNISLEVRTKGYQGEIHKTASVFSNDPKRPQINIGMKGTVWTPIHIEPRYAQLKGIAGEEIQSAVRLTGQKEEPLVVKVASVSIPDKVEVNLEEKEKGRTYLLTVKDKSKVETKYRGKVTLTTNYSDKPEIEIPVAAMITGRLEVRPEILTFGRIPLEKLEQLKTDGRQMTRSVSLVLHKGDDLKIEKVELDGDLFRTSIEEPQPGRTARVIVEPVLEKLKKGANQDRLKIHTNQKGKELVEVPVRLDLM